MNNPNTDSSVSSLSRSLQSVPTHRKEAPQATKPRSDDVFAGQTKRVENTQAALSGLGQLRSAESQLQSSAREVAKANLAKPAEAENTVRLFANNFNRTRQAAADTSLAKEGRADQAGKNIERAVTGTGADRLAKIGITVQQNGSLQVDSKAFQQAVQDNPDAVTSALKEVGTRTEAATNRDVGQNGEGGRLTTRINTVNAEAQRQDQQRSDAIAQVQELQKRYAQPLNNATGNALANYRKAELF